MNEKYYIYISIIAIVIVFVLQYVWFYTTYKVLENDLYMNIDACFKVAVEKELLARAKTAHIPSGTTVPSNRNGNVIGGILGLNDLMNRFDNPRDLKKLDSIYVSELAKMNIHDLSFSIAVIKTDTTYYNSESVFDRDTTFVLKTRKEFKTHIVPALLNLSEGVQATVVNPYRKVLMKMWLLLLCSLIFTMFIVYCIIRQMRIIILRRQIARIRQDFTYAMIHDMKTPVSAISMIGNALHDGTVEDKPTLKANYYRILNEETARLLVLLNRALTIAKFEQKRIKFNIQEVNIPDVICEIADKFKTRTAKKVTFSTKYGHTHLFYTDKEYLCEILDNLIDNSIKYSCEQVEIMISTSEQGQYMELKIRDNGIGISKEDMKRIFRKFERGTNVSVSGHGLGLNFVYQVVKAQKGYILVDSEQNVFTELTIGLLLNP